MEPLGTQAPPPLCLLLSALGSAPRFRSQGYSRVTSYPHHMSAGQQDLETESTCFREEKVFKADFHMHLFSQNGVTQPPQAKVVWWSGKTVLVGRIGSPADGSSVRMEAGGAASVHSFVFHGLCLRSSTSVLQPCWCYGPSLL